MFFLSSQLQMNSEIMTGNVGCIYVLLPNGDDSYERSWLNVKVLSPGYDAQNSGNVAQC